VDFTRAVGIRSWNRTFWGISLIPPCAEESYIWMQAPQHGAAAERDVEAAAMAVEARLRIPGIPFERKLAELNKSVRCTMRSDLA
jgi:hypothetical protein